MIFILHTSSDGLPEGGIGAAHGHSHNHSHNHNHHGHSHSHHSQQSPSLQHHRSSNDNIHRHSELSEGSIVTDTGTGNDDGSVVDTSGTATSIELSSDPLLLNENGLKHQHEG